MQQRLDGSYVTKHCEMSHIVCAERTSFEKQPSSNLEFIQAALPLSEMSHQLDFNPPPSQLCGSCCPGILIQVLDKSLLLMMHGTGLCHCRRSICSTELLLWHASCATSQKDTYEGQLEMDAVINKFILTYLNVWEGYMRRVYDPMKITHLSICKKAKYQQL